MCEEEGAKAGGGGVKGAEEAQGRRKGGRGRNREVMGDRDVSVDAVRGERCKTDDMRRGVGEGGRGGERAGREVARGRSRAL